ncbi:unnamed protein product, partial [Closterium sp. NIES-53]
SPLPAPSPYAEQNDSLTELSEPDSCPSLPVRDVRTGLPLPSPPASSLADGPDLESDLVCAANPTVPCLLATLVTSPSFESAAASALVDELVDFAVACRLDNATSLVAESESDCPPSVGGECALGADVLEDRQEEFECLAAAVHHLVAMLLAPEGDPDAPDIPTSRSYVEAITGTYVNAFPPPRANIVDGMWIFRVKRPPGSPPVFKARYVAPGFSQRQGVDFFHTFSPTPKMTTLWVLLHITAQRDYELQSLDFSTTFLQGSLHEEIWLCRPLGFTGSFPAGTQWSLRRPVLQRFSFTYSSPQSTPLPTGQSLSAPPLDESVEPIGSYPELVGCLMYLMTRTRPDLAYPLSILACYVAPARQRPEHWEVAKRVSRYLCSTLGMRLVLGGRGPVVLTGHADASWRPRSPPVLYVDNKAMIALCQEHRLEHRTKHIAMHYFLARERGRFRLAYVATRANTADIFTKALQPGDHQRFCTVLGL